jgi:arsenate reductase
MSKSEALALLAGNGNLVKRPFVIGERVAIVGFNEERWAAALGQAGVTRAKPRI